MDPARPGIETLRTMKRRRGGADINGVFVALNYVLFAATILFYSQVEFPSLVNVTTLVIYAVLLVQVRIFLSYEKQRRNPFILVLVFVLTFFYFPRIITLYWVDFAHYSLVLYRLRPTTVHDVNATLVFVFFANIFIVLGIIVARSSGVSRSKAVPDAKPHYGFRLLCLLFVTLIYVLYTSVISPLTVTVEKRGLRFLGLILNPSFFISIAIVFLYQFRSSRPTAGRRLSLKRSSIYALGIALLTAVLVVLQILFGSRSAILSLVQLSFFAFLAMGVYRIPRKMLVACGVLLALSVPLFTVSTLSRAIKNAQDTNVRLFEQKDLLVSAVTEAFDATDVARLLGPVLDRTAFLDFSVDLMKNHEAYGTVINPLFYAKSLIDNVTPGFDVFGVPKASNALVYIYNTETADMKRQGDSYQSDQFNAYGEYFVLFGGWASLPAFAFAAFLFESAYRRIRAKGSLAPIVWKYFTIGLFFNWLISFGTDWQIIAATREALLYAVILPILTIRLAGRRVIAGPRLASRDQRPLAEKTAKA
jgi:hypothetical protein